MSMISARRFSRAVPASKLLISGSLDTLVWVLRWSSSSLLGSPVLMTLAGRFAQLSCACGGAASFQMEHSCIAGVMQNVNASKMDMIGLSLEQYRSSIFNPIS